MQFNDIDGIANAMVSAYFCKEGLFDETAIFTVFNA